MKKITKIIKCGKSRRNKISTEVPVRIAVASSMLILASCQTFKSIPLDLDSHSQQWKMRDPSSSTVRDFAQNLAAERMGIVSFNPANGVSLNEGKLIALVYNPDLRVARLKADVTKASAKYAGLWDDPELSLDVLKISQGVPNPWIVGSSISLTVPLSGRLRAEKGRAEAAKHADLDRVAEAEWQVVCDLQQAWISWSAERTKLEQAKKIISALTSIVRSTDGLAEQGELPKTESALFSIELTNRQVELDGLKGSVDAGEQKIRALLGVSPSAPIRLVPNLTVTGSSHSEARLINNNPTLWRLRSEYSVTEYKLLQEIRKQYPDLQIGPQAEEDQGQSRIGFVGSIPLPILNANRGGIAQARAEREVAKAAYETEYERKVGQLATQRVLLRALHAQRKSIESGLIPMVDNQAADAEKLVQLGESGSLVLLESLTRRYEAKMKIIDVLHKQSQVETDIQGLLGPTNYQSTSSKN